MSPAVREKSQAGDQALRDAYEALITEFSKSFVAKSHHPKLVIAIDEVHLLGNQVNNFRRSHVLCQIISTLSKSQQVSNWVIFCVHDVKGCGFFSPIHYTLLASSQPGWPGTVSSLFPFRLGPKGQATGSCGPMGGFRTRSPCRIWSALMELPR